MEVLAAMAISTSPSPSKSATEGGPGLLPGIVQVCSRVLSSSNTLALLPLTKKTSPPESPSMSATAEKLPQPGFGADHSNAPVWE